MRNPWKRFTAWLYYLRHPCTVITMDEAPAKGVNVNLSYTGEYKGALSFKDCVIKWPSEGSNDNAVSQDALAHVEECLDSLHTGIMLGLQPQEAALGQWGLESQKKVVESVKEDFKKLRDAIKALRKEEHGQEDQEERTE